MGKVLERNTVLTFGKYKGKTGGDVAQLNPNYIMWIDRNLSSYEVSKDLKKLAFCCGVIDSEDRAEAFGSAADWGFNAF